YLQTPQVNLIGALNNSIVDYTTNICLEIIDDNLKNVSYNWNKNNNQTIINPFNIPIVLGKGWNQLNIYIEDHWNHTIHDIYNFFMEDTIRPPITNISIWYDENVNAHNVFIEDNFAFVAAYNDGLVIINVTDPANPGSAVYQSTRGTAYDVFVQDGFAYVAEAYIDGSTGGLTVVDVRDPNSPTIYGTYDWYPQVDRIFIDDNQAYLGDDVQGMLILNITDPSTPIYDSTVSNVGTRDIFIKNNYSYTIQISPWNSSENGLAITNITDSKNPGIPIYVNITGGAGEIFVNNNYTYINSLALGGSLAIVNVTNPLNPGDPQFYNLNGYPTYIDGVDNRIFVTNNEYGTNFRLRGVNMTDSQTPGYSSYYDLNGVIPVLPSEGIRINGDYLYIAYYHGLTAIEISDFFDKTGPIISITNPIKREYYRNSVWLNFTINEPTSWIGYSLDGTTNVTILSENILLTDIQEGTHTVQIFANDTAGNFGSSSIIDFNVTFLLEQILLQDSFEDLDIWEVTNPSIMTLNTSFGNSAPSVEINSTQIDLGLCQFEDVFFPILKSKEFIRTSIEVYIPAIQTGSISVFTDITGTKFPFRLRIIDTNSIFLFIYSTMQSSTLSYSFIPNMWYDFTVDLYTDHITLSINGTQLTSISSSFYQSKWVPIAFGDGAQSSPEQGHYFFDNIKVSKMEILPPRINLTSPANNTIQKSGTTIVFTIEDQYLDTAWYTWDEGTNQSFSTAWNVTLALSDGWHQLTLHANDTYGETTTRHYYFYCDALVPVIGLVGLENNTLISSETTIRLNITDFSLQAVWVNWDTGVNQFLSSPFEVSIPFAEGYHWLTVYANDSVGHLTDNKYQWWINPVVPTISLLSPTNATVQNYGAIIVLTIEDDNLDDTWYAWDDSGNQSFLVAWNVTLSLPDGWHQLTVYVNNTKGFLHSICFSFYCDSLYPSIDLIQIENDTVVQSSENIHLNIADAWLDSMWYKWDNSINYLFNDSISIEQGLPEGFHDLYVYANDTIGHQTSKFFRFYVNHPPLIQLQNPSNGSSILPAVEIQLTIVDTTFISSWYQWDSDDTAPLDDPFIVLSINESGWHALTVNANDSWGIVSTRIFSFYILGSPEVEVTQLPPSTAFDGESFLVVFKITNSEPVPLDLTLIIFGFNDDIIEGNNSHIYLNPTETRSIEIRIKPKHASIHELEIVIYLRNEIFFQYTLAFSVEPTWMSPRFYIPFIIFPVLVILLVFIIGLFSFYLYRSTQQLHLTLTEKLSPDRKDVPLSEIQTSTKIPEFLIRMGVRTDRNLILTSDGQIVNKEHQINYIKRQITMITTPIDLLGIAQEHNCSIMLIRSLVKEELNQNKLTGFLHRDVFYPSTFINLVSKTIKRSQIEQLSKFMAKFQLNKQVLAKIVKGLAKTDKTIFTFYINSDEDKIVIITNQTWKEIAKYLASSTGLKIRQIIPDLTASNWQSIFKQQKFAFFQYNDRFFNINGLQEYSVNHLDEISRIIHYVRHQLPHLPLSRSLRDD
ncbi:MAG: LVIVD repeat-containing protein, partial [Candidatus Kariarchaeaceae archaeon]